VDSLGPHLLVAAANSTAAFDRSLLVLGGLLVFGALLSGLARRSFLSLTALFVVAGFVLGNGGLEVLSFSPRSSFVDASSSWPCR